MSTIPRQRYEDLRAKWYEEVETLPPHQQYFCEHIADFLGGVPQWDIKLGHVVLAEEALRKINMIDSPHFKTILQMYIAKQSSMEVAGLD